MPLNNVVMWERRAFQLQEKSFKTCFGSHALLGELNDEFYVIETCFVHRCLK